MSSNQSTSSNEGESMGILNAINGNGHVALTNGKSNAEVGEENSMSEDEVPLVRYVSLFNVSLHALMISLVYAVLAIKITVKCN